MCQATNCRMRTIIINVYDRVSVARGRKAGIYPETLSGRCRSGFRTAADTGYRTNIVHCKANCKNASRCSPMGEVIIYYYAFISLNVFIPTDGP